MTRKEQDKHNLQPSLTYEDVVRELRKAMIGFVDKRQEYFTSIKQSKKEYAIHKLLNVAKYLNKNEDGSDWVPDWKNNEEEKWSIRIIWDKNNKPVIKVGFYFGTADGTIGHCNNTFVYFRTKKLAEQAIQILGETVIRTALTTEY